MLFTNFFFKEYYLVAYAGCTSWGLRQSERPEKQQSYQIWVQCQQTGLCLLEKLVYLHLPRKGAKYVNMSNQERDKLNLRVKDHFQ